jgi:hypothetical protein
MVPCPRPQPAAALGARSPGRAARCGTGVGGEVGVAAAVGGWDLNTVKYGDRGRARLAIRLHRSRPGKALVVTGPFPPSVHTSSSSRHSGRKTTGFEKHTRGGQIISSAAAECGRRNGKLRGWSAVVARGGVRRCAGAEGRHHGGGQQNHRGGLLGVPRAEAQGCSGGCGARAHTHPGGTHTGSVCLLRSVTDS